MFKALLAAGQWLVLMRYDTYVGRFMKASLVYGLCEVTSTDLIFRNKCAPLSFNICLAECTINLNILIHVHALNSFIRFEDVHRIK